MSNSEENSTEAKDTERIYEAGYHLLPTLSEGEVKDLVSELKSGIQKAGGEILSEEEPSRISLAYGMERSEANKKTLYHESYFGWIKFEGEGELITNVEEMFKNNENILRFLVIKTVREDTFYKKKESEEVYRDAGGESGNENEEDGGDDENETTKDLDESIDELVVK